MSAKKILCKLTKYPLTIIGLIMLVISCMLIWKNFERKWINDRGFEVAAIIFESPSSCDNIRKRTGYCKLEYDGKIYVKRAGNKFCHLVSGKETVTMLTNEDGSELLFPEEYKVEQFVYAFILIIISTLIIRKAIYFN